MRSTGRRTELAVFARDLSVEYRSRRVTSRYAAVNGVSFEIARGEVLGLVGESGSGKSTLAALIAGIPGDGIAGGGVPEICGGSLSVLGQRMRGIGSRARDRLALRVGYLAQEGANQLNPRLTIAENIGEPIYARDRHFDSQLAGRAVATLVDAVQLPLGVMKKQPYELSSGQLQRAALARALILEPALLVADEPIRGVDVTARSAVMNVVRELQRQREFSALIISSDLDSVAAIADRIAVMYQGTIVGIGSMEGMLADPEHPYLKGLARSREHGMSHE